VIEDFQFDEVENQKNVYSVESSAIDKQKTLLLTKGTDQTLVKSGRNIAKTPGTRSGQSVDI